jgi:hypothetical protein
MALSAQSPAPERAITNIAVRVVRVDTNAIANLFGSDSYVNLWVSRAVFLANILIVAEDDKTSVGRAAEMFGYKFLLASFLGIA